MKINRKVLIIGGVVAAFAISGMGIAYAVGAVGGDNEEQVSGPGADRAKAAAVKAVGGGSVVAAERSDSGSAYEVEVKRDDGSVVEVQVNDQGKAGATGSDDGGSGDESGDNEGQDGENEGAGD